MRRRCQARFLLPAAAPIADAQVIASASKFMTYADALPTLQTLGAEIPEAVAVHAPQEMSSYEQIIAQVKLLGDDTATFVQRSEIFRDRGLSSDTSLRPNYGIEVALKELLAQGMIQPKSLNRVAMCCSIWSCRTARSST